MFKPRRIGAALAACGALGTASAQEATFKAYGFMDVLYQRQSFGKNNFLVNEGILSEDAHLSVDHVNTYFDWRPVSDVRVLAELSLNRDPQQVSLPGTRLVFDSASVHRDLDAKIGASTRAGMLLFLQNTPPYSSLPSGVQSHLADSLAQDTLSKTVHGIAQGVRAASQVSSPSKKPKDHGIAIPRVHVDLLLRDEFNLRVGKFVTPAGIWNVDHGSPAILTVKQPYETSFFPIFPENQTGVQGWGKLVVADQDLSYAGWISTGRGASALGMGDYGQAPENFDDWAWGSHLQADLGLLDGIRLGATFHTGTLRGSDLWGELPVVEVDLATQTPVTDLAGLAITKQDVFYMRELCYGLDSKIEWNKFLLQGEWNHRKVLNLQAGSKETDFDAGYVLLGRTFGLGGARSVTPYVMHERIVWENTSNNPGLGFGAIPVDGFATYIAGVNFAYNSALRLKLEYSATEIGAVRYESGETANTYSDDDLSVTQVAGQISVAF